jgi:hypothetical protein
MRIFRNSGHNNVDHIKNVDRGWSVEKKIMREIMRESFANAENTVKAQVVL